MKPEDGSVRFGGTTIEYQVRRSSRRRKTVQVTVDGPGVQVAVPQDTPDEDEQARAAMSHAHAAAGIAKADNPGRHPVVAEVVKGWRNQAAAPRQAAALTAAALARVRETARLPRRGRGGGYPGVDAAGAWSPRPWHRPGAPSTWQSSE